MAGIYIHIPFCRKACHYCNFHFSTSFQKSEEMIIAILKETVLRREYLEGQEIRTIYFGGGTPSAITPIAIEGILNDINKYFQISSEVEITLEANPDDIHSDSAMAWKSMGINRLSIGIQAFQDVLLKSWNRSHTSAQAKEAIRISKYAGFRNITADLIYGGVGLTDKDWFENIEILIEFGIPHLSCYALTVEPGTALAYQIKTGTSAAPDDEQSNRQYAILQSKMKQSGFEQYEVSNFCIPGYQSIHNTSYWSGEHYLGIGPSAHSYNGASRQWNAANNIHYIDSISSGIIPNEFEILTPSQRYNEMVMTGIRTVAGIKLAGIKMLDKKYEEYLLKQLDAYIKQGKIAFRNNSYILNPENYFFADGIASDLFFQE